MIDRVSRDGRAGNLRVQEIAVHHRLVGRAVLRRLDLSRHHEEGGSVGPGVRGGVVQLVRLGHGIVDVHAGELVALASHTPIQMCGVAFAVRAAIDEFRAEGFREGDVIMVNDPYRGGNHLPDVSLITPFFWTTIQVWALTLTVMSPCRVVSTRLLVATDLTLPASLTG